MCYNVFSEGDPMGIVLTEINKTEALRFMGYGKSSPDDLTMKRVNECEKALISVIKPEYVYRIFDIDQSDNSICICGTSLILTGNDIKKHLEGCSKAALIAVTISEGADRLIRSYAAYDMAKSVITDCLASAAVEQVCNEVDKIISETVEQKYQTWRFSPGYGDLPLEVQKDFLDVLNAGKRIGLCVLDNFMMVPTKSVTAIIGLSDKKINKGVRGCACCNMREKCTYRIRGEHCEF